MWTVGLAVVVVLVCCSIFVNGWTDAPNAITTVISTRVLSPKAAIGLAAVFNLLGVLLSGSAVANTISGMIKIAPGNDALITLAAAQISIVVWAVGAWRFGIPTSESHALIAGLTGAALATGGISIVSWEAWQKVLMGLLIASVIGFVSGWFVTLGVAKAVGRTNRKKVNKFFSFGQIVSASAMAFSHGAQDGQKFLGVFIFAMYLGGFNIVEATTWTKVLCAGIMAIGTSIGGYRIIKTMGMDMVKIEKYQGFSSEVAASACMITATVFGIPLSTTNCKGTALMGAAASKRLSNVNWGIVKEMVLAWVLTFPACALIGYLMTLLLKAIF
jgi:PiT family inorganic phosphate transporter